MATGPVVNQGKTAFLEEFLPGNRAADLDEANRAWNAAGNEGTLSDSLLGKIRSKLGLTAKKGTGRKASQGSSPGPQGQYALEEAQGRVGVEARGGLDAARCPGRVEKGSNKSAFVEGLAGSGSPDRTLKKVNEAWASAGHEDTISPLHLLQDQAGAWRSGRDRGPEGGGRCPRSPGHHRRMARPSPPPPWRSPTPKAARPPKADVPVKAASPVTPPAVTHPAGAHGRELHQIEGEIDELVFRLKGLGDFAEVQEALRAARRLLIRSHEH